MSFFIKTAMNINALQNNYYCGHPQPITSGKKQSPSFKGNGVQRLTNINIGMMPQGFIGEVALFNKKLHKNVFVNVFKEFDCGDEIYSLKDENNQPIGKLALRIKKYFDYDKSINKDDPSHVYVADLYNFSRKDTPFANQNTDDYSHVGIRLLQIAQRRSDEAQCSGNIKLNAMPEALSFYRSKIGMQSDPDAFNENFLFLPWDKKETLSRMYDGL